jgi:hypothetical protein
VRPPLLRCLLGNGIVTSARKRSTNSSKCSRQTKGTEPETSPQRSAVRRGTLSSSTTQRSWPPVWVIWVRGFFFEFFRSGCRDAYRWEVQDVALQDFLYGFGEVLQQVPAVGDLDGAWGATAGSVYVGTVAVAGDDPHTGVPSKPPLQDSC